MKKLIKKVCDEIIELSSDDEELLNDIYFNLLKLKKYVEVIIKFKKG